ncbi:MAG: hypothetical protein EKK56_06055 [Flavobacteriaceae bacterium]|nr:MAG: hypothetical protein EKK56_06055 [Flavobacteriaceae bacterium]
MRSFSERREINKLGLETFFLNLENNHYDYNINNLVIDLENKIKTLEEKEIKNHDDEIEIIFLYKELFAISEMKIIYAYKHFEIHLKFLIKASYPDTKESSFFKWESVVDFLKSKNIKLSEISNHKEIEELRNLNNSIKHSRNLINNKTKNIEEFTNKKEIDYKDLLIFYKRIEKASSDFIFSLAKHIEKDLYHFDDKRIESIAQKILLRMDDKTVQKLIQKLK